MVLTFHFTSGIARSKQRGYVSVDVCVPHEREADAMIQLTKAHDVISHIQQIKHVNITL